MDKKDFWPEKGKLKKGLIILAIVIIASLLMVLAEEKTNLKFTRKVPMAVAFICVAVWFYKPQPAEKDSIIKADDHE